MRKTIVRTRRHHHVKCMKLQNKHFRLTIDYINVTLLYLCNIFLTRRILKYHFLTSMFSNDLYVWKILKIFLIQNHRQSHSSASPQRHLKRPSSNSFIEWLYKDPMHYAGPDNDCTASVSSRGIRLNTDPASGSSAALQHGKLGHSRRSSLESAMECRADAAESTAALTAHQDFTTDGATTPFR